MSHRVTITGQPVNIGRPTSPTAEPLRPCCLLQKTGIKEERRNLGKGLPYPWRLAPSAHFGKKGKTLRKWLLSIISMRWFDFSLKSYQLLRDGSYSDFIQLFLVIRFVSFLLIPDVIRIQAVKCPKYYTQFFIGDILSSTPLANFNYTIVLSILATMLW